MNKSDLVPFISFFLKVQHLKLLQSHYTTHKLSVLLNLRA